MKTWKAGFDFVSRIASLKKKLGKTELTAIVITNPFDIFYLTGMHLSLGFLLVEMKRAVLFVDNRYQELAKKTVSIDVLPLTDETLQENFPKGRLGFDSAVTTYQEFQKLKKLHASLEPIEGILREGRSIKDAQEISWMKKSAKIAYQSYRYAASKLKVGITEEAIAWEFEKKARELGASSLSFSPIIAFGENSAMPHYRSGCKKLKRGEIVLCDVGVMLGGYASDMTRMIHFGKIDPNLMLAEKVVRKAHAAALKICRNGALAKDLDLAARKEMQEHGLEGHFLHTLGHGVGLEIHEFPRIGKESPVKLLSGMVITIEPGLYFPGLGGIRYEDTVVVNNRGYENFYPE